MSENKLQSDHFQLSRQAGIFGSVWGVVSKYRKIFQWVFAVFCLLWVGWYLQHNRQGLHLLGSVKGPILILLLLLTALHIWLYSLQFCLILRKCTQVRIPILTLFKTIILGRFLSSIAPQAGGIYRAIYLKQQFQIPYTHYISGFFSFLWIDAAMNILLSALIFGLFNPAFQVGTVSVWWILLAMTGVWLVPLATEYCIGKRTDPTGRLGRLHARFTEMLRISVGSIRDIKMILAIAGFNTVNFFNNLLIFSIILSGASIKPTLPVLAVFFILLKITSYLILTPGNIGIREIAYGFLSSHMGFDTGEGMTLSLFYRFLGVVVVLLLSVCFGGLHFLRKDSISSS